MLEKLIKLIIFLYLLALQELLTEVEELETCLVHMTTIIDRTTTNFYGVYLKL
jgi:hypothetical protein